VPIAARTRLAPFAARKSFAPVAALITARHKIALVAVAAILGGCARGIAPEPLPLDRYNCARCGMMISEIADAAQYVSPREETRFYDDLGCAAADAGRVPIRGRFFVRADGGARWIAADEAFYAKTGDRSPMGYGYFAFSTQAQATARGANGRALRWGDVGGGK
jgi:nitrous oxide reductase accessory protein NosL